MSFALKPLVRQLSLLCILPGLAHAAEADLETVVVTAARAPLLLEHATGEVAVVGKSDIEAKNATRLTDVIDRLPGVFLSNGKGISQPSPGFALRGVPSDSRTLILLDGVPLNDGYSGSALLAGIPVGAVRQAEVLYGPMSSLYGGNAMGGVVNFVTAMPKRFEFGFDVGYGNAFEAGKAPADVVKGMLYVGNRFANDVAVRLGFNWAQSGGYFSDYLTGTTAPAGTSGAIRTNDQYGATSYLLGSKGGNTWYEQGVSLKVEQRLADGARWFAGWLQQENRYDYGDQITYLTRTTAPVGAPYYSAPTSEGQGGRYARQLSHLGYERDLGAGRLNLVFSYSQVSVNSSVISTGTSTTPPNLSAFGGPGRITDSPYTSKTADGYWVASLGAHDLTVGAAYKADAADATTYNLSQWTDAGSLTSLYTQAAGRTELLGAYLQDNWRLTPALILQGGLRYDYWKNSDGHGYDSTGVKTYEERSDSALSPKLGASFRATETLTLRASAGSAFRAPTVYDLYRSSVLSSYNTIANPALKPETVRTWELGADWKPWADGELRATWFHNDIRDLITLGPRVWNAVISKNERQRLNAGRAISEGLTLSFTQRLSAVGKLFANLTYTRSEVKENDADTASVGKRLQGLPDKQANIGYERDAGDWRWSIAGRFASKQYNDSNNSDTATGVYRAYDGYVVADTKVTYRLDKQTSLSLAVDNLFDREYYSYYPAPRRSWFASVKYDY